LPGGLALEEAAPARRIWLKKIRCGIVGIRKFSSKLFFPLKHRTLEYVAVQFSVLSKANPTVWGIVNVPGEETSRARFGFVLKRELKTN
jgi:hypothetical protein